MSGVDRLWKLPRLAGPWKNCRFAWKAGLEDSATFPQFSHSPWKSLPPVAIPTAAWKTLRGLRVSHSSHNLDDDEI